MATLNGVFDMFGGLDTTSETLPDGTELAMISSVPDSPRAVMLLLHGFTGSKEDFLFLVPELAAAGLAAFAVDHRGAHQSVSPGPFDLATLAEDVCRLAERLAERFAAPVHLVGHSFGGLVAQRAVVASPETFASLTLMCSGPAGFRASAEEIPITIERVSYFRDALTGSTLDEAWETKTAYENVEMHPAMERFLRERFVVGDHDAAMTMIDDLLSAGDVIDDVAATGLPVFVMYGEHDGTWNQRTQNDMAARLGTTAQVIVDSTHLPAIENVDDTAAQIVANVRSVAAKG